MTSAQVLESRALLTAIILEPTAGQQTSDRTPTIRWSDDNAQTYEVWVSVLGSSPQSVHIQNGITGTSYDVPTDLTIEGHRVWVRSHYANGQTSSWSTPRDFEVIAPTLPAPVTTSNVTANSATVSWNAVPGASTYDVYVREDGIGRAIACRDVKIAAFLILLSPLITKRPSPSNAAHLGAIESQANRLPASVRD